MNNWGRIQKEGTVEKKWRPFIGTKESEASRNTQSLPSPKESPQRFILRETEAPKPARTRQRGGDTSRNENDYEGQRWAPKGASTSLASPTLRPRYPRDPRTSLDTLVLGESSSSRSVQIEMHQVRPRHRSRSPPSRNSDTAHKEEENKARGHNPYFEQHAPDPSLSSLTTSPMPRPHRDSSSSQAPHSLMSPTRTRASLQSSQSSVSLRPSSDPRSRISLTSLRAPNSSLLPSPQPRPRSRPPSSVSLAEPSATRSHNLPYSITKNHYPAYDTNRRRIGLDHVSFDETPPPVSHPTTRSYYRPHTQYLESAEPESGSLASSSREPRPHSSAPTNSDDPLHDTHSLPSPQPRKRDDGRRWMYAAPGRRDASPFYPVPPEAFDSAIHEQAGPHSSSPPSPLPYSRRRPQRSPKRTEKLIGVYGGRDPPEGTDEVRWLEERERLQEQGVLPLTDDEKDPPSNAFTLRPVSPQSPPPSPRPHRNADLRASKPAGTTSSVNTNPNASGSNSQSTRRQRNRNDREDSVETEEMSEEHLRKLLGVGPTEEISLDSLADPAPGERPDYPLPTLVKLAIWSSPKKRLTLQEIYQSLQDRFPWYRGKDEAWKNSIRHSLSLRSCFRKVTRPITEPGKGCYWTLDLAQGEGNKRERKRNRPASKRAQEAAAKQAVEAAATADRSSQGSSQEPHEASYDDHHGGQGHQYQYSPESSTRAPSYGHNDALGGIDYSQWSVGSQSVGMGVSQNTMSAPIEYADTRAAQLANPPSPQPAVAHDYRQDSYHSSHKVSREAPYSTPVQDYDYDAYNSQVSHGQQLSHGGYSDESSSESTSHSPLLPHLQLAPPSREDGPHRPLQRPLPPMRTMSDSPSPGPSGSYSAATDSSMRLPAFGTAVHSSSRFGKAAFGEPGFRPVGIRPESSLYLGRAILGSESPPPRPSRNDSGSGDGKRREKRKTVDERGDGGGGERKKRKKGRWVPPPLRPGYEYVKDENGLWTVQSIEGIDPEPVKWLRDFGGDTEEDRRRMRYEAMGGREISEDEYDRMQEMEMGEEEEQEYDEQQGGTSFSRSRNAAN